MEQKENIELQYKKDRGRIDNIPVSILRWNIIVISFIIILIVIILSFSQLFSGT